eukprot:3400939-Pyramimonas_sp.AAC.2
MAARRDSETHLRTRVLLDVRAWFSIPHAANWSEVNCMPGTPTKDAQAVHITKCVYTTATRLLLQVFDRLASNLLRSLKQIREAAALGLLEDPALDNLKTTARQTKPPLSRQIQVRTNDIPCLQKQEREASPNIHVALHGVQIKT